MGLGTGLEHADTRAAHATMLKQAWELGVIPVQDTLAMQWVEQVLPLFRLDSRHRLRFDRSGIEALQDDKEQVFRRWGNAYQRGLAMRSEGRQALGLQVRPADEVFVEEVKAASNPMALPVPADSPPRSLPSGRRALTEENIALIAAMERIRERAERALTAGLKEALDDLGALVSAEYLRIVEEEGLRQVPDDLDLAEIQRIVDKVMDGWVGWAGDWNKTKWDEAAREGLEATTLWMRTGLTNQLDLVLGAPDPLVRKVLAEGGIRLGLIDIQSSTRTKLFKMLSNEPIAGMHPFEAAKRIAKEVPAGPWKSSEIRGRVIARTETHWAQNVVSLDTYREGGFTHVTAVDNQLDFDDTDCKGRDGQVFTIEEAEGLYDHPNGTLNWAPFVQPVGYTIDPKTGEILEDA